MFSNRTLGALIVIAMASSVVIGNGFGDSASATNNNSKKSMKSLSKCQISSATDGDLTLAETKDCYNQAFSQGQADQKDPNAPRGADGPENDREQQQSSLDDPKIGSMREGFNF
jgi:hypothetical protein